MALRITTNMASINAQRALTKSQTNINTSFAQLSSGERITKAADDAAGLSISDTLRSHIKGFQQAQRNTQDAMSMAQTAEGGLNEISNILIRMRELGVQAASDTVGEAERSFINLEVSQLKDEAQRIAKATRFGNIHLLDGSADTFDFQVDIGNDDFNDRITFEAGKQVATTDVLGIDSFDFSQKSGAKGALTTIEDALHKVNGYRATLGAIQNRLISADSNLGVSIENISAANSRVRDTDIAQSTAELTRNNILLNASTAVLAQANAQPSMALKLLD